MRKADELDNISEADNAEVSAFVDRATENDQIGAVGVHVDPETLKRYNEYLRDLIVNGKAKPSGDIDGTFTLLLWLAFFNCVLKRTHLYSHFLHTSEFWTYLHRSPHAHRSHPFRQRCFLKCFFPTGGCPGELNETNGSRELERLLLDIVLQA